MIFFLFEQKSPQREIRKEVWNVLRPKKTSLEEIWILTTYFFYIWKLTNL